MKVRLIALAVCVGWLSCGTAFAHHAFDADFDEKDRITIKGTLTKMDWVNPHSWIYISVKSPNGEVTNWAVETGAPALLMRQGLTKNDFHVGMAIAIDGYRAKVKPSTMAGRIVRLPDGSELFLR